MTKMREMLRCLICGRSAWPTMLSRGQLGLHKPESLRFVKGRGKGKGIVWERRDLSHDAETLKTWLLLLREVFRQVRRRLEEIGASAEDLDQIETELLLKAVSVVRPSLVCRPPTALRSSVVVHPQVRLYRRAP